MVTQPPFHYYGSKARLARWIIDQMTDHSVYIEPFAGSAAVFFAKPLVPYEVINDIDDDIVNFFRVLRDHEKELIKALTLTPYSRTEYRLAWDEERPSCNIERARRFMVRACMGFNGVAGRCVGFSFSSFQARKAKASTFSRRVDRTLSHVAHRLRNAEIEHTDALILLDRFDYPETTVYADPPYLGESRKTGDRYRYDARGPQFHRVLLERLDAFSGEVVLSGHASDLYSELLPAGRWSMFTRNISMSTSNKSSTRHTEALWVKRRNK